MSSRYAYDDEDYYDDRRQYRGGPGSVQTRARGNREEEPDFYREEVVTQRGRGPMIYRGRDDSVEDIERDFPPPGRRRQSRARSVGTRRYSDDYSDDDRYTQHSRRSRGTRRGGGRDYDSEYSRSPPPRDRRKSGIEDVLGGLGLGGIAAALTGKKDHDDDRSVRSRSRAASRARSRRGSRSSSRSRGGRHETERKWAQAAQAALIAGAVEAFRSRKEPGPWTGDKGKRIATAAIGAGGIDGLLDRNPNEKSKRHLAEAVIGGLAANRLANGPRSQSRGRDRNYSPDGSRAPSAAPSGLRARSKSIIDRFRGRSQSRPRSVGPDGSERGGGSGNNNNGIKTLAAGGALAAAGKAIYDRVRSKSRNRGRSRSGSRSSSADSYVPSRKNRRRRRQPRGSIRSPPPTDSPRGLAAGPTARGRDPSARGRGIDDYNPNSGGGNGARDALVAGGAGAGAAALGAQSNQGAERNGGGGGGGGGGGENGENSTKGADATDQVSESSSTTDMENKRKRMKGKELLTAGLATIATIHAAHGVYSSMESHEKRHKLVAEGEMSPEEARKKQTKAWVQDAAAVGIAALGIKGAFSEWKEMNEQRREIHEIEKRKRDRRKRRERLERQKEEQRQERLMQLAQHNPQLAMLQSGLMQQGGRNGAAMPMPQFPMQQFQQGGGDGGGGGGGVDQSGNPYASRS